MGGRSRWSAPLYLIERILCHTSKSLSSICFRAFWDVGILSAWITDREGMQVGPRTLQTWEQGHHRRSDPVGDGGEPDFTPQLMRAGSSLHGLEQGRSSHFFYRERALDCLTKSSPSHSASLFTMVARSLAAASSALRASCLLTRSAWVVK